MIQLCGLSPEELSSWITELGEKSFRAQQVLSWVKQGTPVQNMNNLSLKLRETISALAVTNPVKIRQTYTSKLDGTRKFLYELMDGNLIEGVLMKYHYGYTLCVSTQVGCNMGCAFCASTLEGCVRHLTAGEIVGQVLCANEVLLSENTRVGNVVLMGSGEPLDNYANVVRFLRLITDERGMNMSVRGISLSTCGLVDRLNQFSEEGLPVTLSLSLHAPNDAIRKELMPIAKRYTIDETLMAVRGYVKKTGRRAVFEYILIDGVNCEKSHACELAQRLRGLQCHVNVIPLNTVEERNLHSPSEKQVSSFLHELECRHISATRRREMGSDLHGACGQLRRSVLQNRQTGEVKNS